MSEVKPYKNSKFQIKLPLILAIGISGGILIGATLSEPASSEKDLYDSVMKFKEVLNYIDKRYVDEVDTDQLVEEAIESMLNNLDPHSTYIPAEDKISANESLKGNFDGIGVEFNIFRDTIVVVAPLSGGPSEAVGIRSGDKIIKINGKDVAGVGFTNKDVQDNLKGPKGTEVAITVIRNGSKNPIEFTIIRDKIPQFSIDASYMVDHETGYIKISRFSATTYEEFKDALKTLKGKGMNKLVLDLQGNPGGYMNHAISIADEFLPDKRKIVQTKGKMRSYNDEVSARKKGIFEEGELIVLVNEGSASASEIVSGALQDNDRALIVGRRTFGKGLVQAPLNLSDGSELRLTISRYYTPSGRSIQKPYSEKGDYGAEILDRFNHGEFFHSDSIKFNDSLKYQTITGRTVYGGGGIMPDYFVPLDTTKNSPYLNELFYSNTVQEYTFNYTELNWEKIEEMGYENYYNNFKVSERMLKDLVEMGSNNGIEPNFEELKKHKVLFETHIKAQIARQVWKNTGFYPIFNHTNEILQQAIKLLKKPKKIDQSKF